MTHKPYKRTPRPTKKKGEPPTAFQNRLEAWKLARAVAKREMLMAQPKGTKRAGIASREWIATLPPDENW